MYRKFLLFILLILSLGFEGRPQNPEYVFSGTVINSKTNEAISGAIIQIKETNQTILSDTNGMFHISLNKGTYNIKVSYIGFHEYSYKLKLTEKFQLTVNIKPELMLNEVIISGNAVDRNVKDAKPGETEINASEIRKLPAMLGEVDILKSIQLIPGVQASDAGGTSLYIRGSSFGENLMLYDNAVIYNPSHLMGFFSVFNTDAIEKVKLIKSGMSSEYGGRIASVIEVTGKNGDLEKPSVSGGIGLISSHLSLESPINKGKGSIIISGRRTYLDFIGEMIKESFPSNISNELSFFKTTRYYFYDLNIKALYKLTNKDILTLSSYMGNDDYKYEYINKDYTKMDWGNKLISFQWAHNINKDIYFNQTIYITDYNFGFKTLQDKYNFQLNSGTTDWSYKFDVHITKFKNNKIKAGIDYIFHNMMPTKISADAFDLKLKFADMSNLYSNEYAAYINDEIAITSKLDIIAGFRYSLFQQRGPFTDYEKDNNGQTLDTIYYKKHQLIKSYSKPEPRISLCYLLNETSSLKASFTQNEQYIHLVSLPSVSMPTDIWIPSMKNITPEFGTQYTLGYFRNFQNNAYESYIDAYYKHIDNLIEFDRGIINSAFEQTLYSDITTGKGNMIGIEFYLKKNKGKFTGTLSYTLAKATEKCNNLNEGKTFFSSQDRRHNLSVMLNYELNKKWTFAVIMVYISGKPVTLPDKLLVIDENLISEYGEMNTYRLPAYYRMDISANYKVITRRKLESTLSFSIYNVLNRANPFFVYFKTTGSIEKYNLNIEAKQISLFPILPSISWEFKF